MNMFLKGDVSLFLRYTNWILMHTKAVLLIPLKKDIIRRRRRRFFIYFFIKKDECSFVQDGSTPVWDDSIPVCGGSIPVRGVQFLCG